MDRNRENINVKSSLAFMLVLLGCGTTPADVHGTQTVTASGPTCGGVDCDPGDEVCKVCKDAGQCADGPDPIWTGTECICADSPDHCTWDWCCRAGEHWEALACSCVPDGTVSQCVGGIAACDGNPDCEVCIDAGGCSSGPDPVWNGTQCVCAGFPRYPDNCGLPYCCASGAFWDPYLCACRQ
jgi:hypothetical protein